MSEGAFTALFFGGPLDGQMRTVQGKEHTIRVACYVRQEGDDDAPVKFTEEAYVLTSGGSDETRIYEHIESTSPVLDAVSQAGWVERQLRKMIEPE